MPSSSPIANALAGLAACALLALVLLAAGQPLFGEDSWWHLSMGAAYAAQGPWLDRDPLLHTAPGPPAPAAWLADLALFEAQRFVGFQGLRVLHALTVLGILVLAWSALRRAGATSSLATLGTAVFAALSAYRLFQLRPHLLSMACAIALVHLLLLRGGVPSWRRVAASSLLLALWANLHGAFLVGLVLLLAAVGGLVVAAWLEPGGRALHLARARRLAIATGLGLVATLVNPEGLAPHRLYFAAGERSPSLSLVQDEWASALLSSPFAPGPPSPLNWVLTWMLVLGCGAGLVAWLRAVRGRRVAGTARAGAVDPALVGVALASAAGAAWALRLSWLGLFPLLWLAQVFGPRLGERERGARSLSWVAAGVAGLLLPAFVFAGDWPMISRGVRPALYGRPYPAVKYHAHAVWFLRDSGLEGRLFNDYGSGNFLGYWLAPRAKVFVNGSLNVPRELMRAHAALLRREGLEGDGSFEALLDRYGIDVFFGVGLPQTGVPAPQHVQTTTHLEGAAGWLTVFRNIRSSVSLRMGPGSQADLDRVAAYYAAAGVPFDPRLGFRVERVVREAPQWAWEHGLVPLDWRGLQEAARSLDPALRRPAQERLASLWLALGVYGRSEAIDRTLVASAPPSVTAGRRLVWALLHQGRYDEAAETARTLSEIAPEGDALSRLVASTAREAAALSSSGQIAEAEARAAMLPVFDGSQAAWLLAGFREPEARIR